MRHPKPLAANRPEPGPFSTPRVSWEIEIDDTDDPLEAARLALSIQRDPMSIATVFER